MKRSQFISAACTAVAVTIITASACEAPSSKSDSSDTAKATSAKKVGGMKKLEKKAKSEGKLNVIALPPDWANYGAIIKNFKKKYGIKVHSAKPDGDSQDEINAAKQLKGSGRQPDVFDLGETVSDRNKDRFASYKVTNWDTIPKKFKASDGTWFNDYGGITSIGYNSKKVPKIKNISDLRKPAFKGKVALNGDPTRAAAGYSGVLMASVANGGSPDDMAPGVRFFKQLKHKGNMLAVDPTPATIESGETPVVIDWDYTNAAEKSKVSGWKTVIPPKASIASYYVQAINKDAAHPAAARLWEEYLYSDKVQNQWLKGGARPVRLDGMKESGTVDKDAYKKLPKTHSKETVPTTDDVSKGTKYLKKHWGKLTG